MTSELTTERSGATLVLAFGTQRFGGLTPQVMAAGVEAIGVAESMGDVKAIVLRIDNPRVDNPRADGATPAAPDPTALAQLLDAIRTCPKPVVAALDGQASGAFTALVWACDLVVAGADAQAFFADPAAASRCSGEAGPLWANGLPGQLVRQLLWLEEPLAGERLHGLGMVNLLTPPGRALHGALGLAEKLARHDASWLSQSKENLRDH